MENEIKIKTKTASMAINSFGDRVIKIMFPYELEMIEKVRTLSGRKYHNENHCWSAPIRVESLNDLIKWGFILDDRLDDFLEKIKVRTEEIVSVGGIPGLKGTLYPFQNVGVGFIESKNGRALVADEMGTGKSIEALAYLQLHRDKIPVIIVVPASLKLNWKKEAETWLPNPKVEILSGTTPWRTKGDILIINYDILPDWVDVLKKKDPQVLILDEVHYTKSSKAQRTKAVKKLGKGIPHIIGLSGTPIVNRPIEAFNAINLINPDLFPNFFAFTRHFCNARHNGFGWDFNGASNTKELHEILTNSIMIRRLKKDVLTELPDKIYSFVPIELNNSKEYKDAESNFIRFVRQTKGDVAAERASNAETLAAIEGLKQLAVKGKLPDAISWIKNFLEVDGKLVVFATHKFVIEALMNEFKGIAVKLDGMTNLTDRQRSVDVFQHNPEVKLFIGNIQAAGIGITLTAASNVAFLELPWTPGALVQASDRVHRIGQKDSVTIHYLLATESIEERIAKLLDSKRKVLDAVLDGIETKVDSLLSELIKEYDK